MKIVFTREAIAAHLANTKDMRYDLGDSYVTYCLRMTPKQELVTKDDNYEFTFTARRDVMRYLGCKTEADLDDLYDAGIMLDYTLLGDMTLDNPEFAAVVDDLYAQAEKIFTENASLIDSWYDE